jgi:hypothetical protein
VLELPGRVLRLRLERHAMGIADQSVITMEELNCRVLFAYERSNQLN